ncbi:MAG TPA: hypothetical protein VK525_05835 [Candidatus Saccharimonadales bacterium]|nr:hypothetical protein [Candidatus Saccharimonadales bacterium]
MTEIAWETANSVEVNASLSFAWKYWTDVSNWDDPPARFELAGEFANGAHGFTRIPRQHPLPWFVRDVHPMSGATIEMPLEGATISFRWQFESLAAERTKLTQRILLTGEKAGTHLAQAKSMFTANLPAGMSKLAVAIANAFSTGKISSGNASS